MKKPISSVVITLVAAGMLAACSNPSSTAAPAGGANAASGANVQLTVKEYAFTPATISAKAGQPITVTLQNQGAVEHNFTISALKVDQDIEKGESEKVTFTPTQAGTLQFFCEYHKESNGMVGTLNVTA